MCVCVCMCVCMYVCLCLCVCLCVCLCIVYTRTDNLHDDSQATAVKDLETPPPPAMQSLGLAEDYVQVLNLCLLSLPDSVWPSVRLPASLSPSLPPSRSPSLPFSHSRARTHIDTNTHTHTCTRRSSSNRR